MTSVLRRDQDTDVYVQREDHVKTQGEAGLLQAGVPQRKQTCQHPDLGLLASGTVKT